MACHIPAEQGVYENVNVKIPMNTLASIGINTVSHRNYMNIIGTE
jgi:hypothetical protein